MLSTPALPRFVSRVIPVVVVEEAAQAVPLAQALLAGGIDVIEITLRSAVALRAIEAIARSVPAVRVGAGTITQPGQVADVIAAGATFGLSPGATPILLDAVRRQGLPFVPGVATPSEAMAAREAGFHLLKVFPATLLGGPEMLKAWAGPLPDLRFCPTGGITATQLAAYLALPQVAMVGGSWITPTAALRAGDWASVTHLAAQAMQAAQAIGHRPNPDARP